jgi:hypothetical protein
MVHMQAAHRNTSLFHAKQQLDIYKICASTANQGPLDENGDVGQGSLVSSCKSKPELSKAQQGLKKRRRESPSDEETSEVNCEKSGEENSIQSSIGGPSNKKRVSSITRVRTGCFTCRKRKKKCDQGLPGCNNCFKSNKVCEGYPMAEFFVPRNELAGSWKSGVVW